MDVTAFLLQASVIAILVWTKVKHHSASKSVEGMGWSVLALGIANLFVDVNVVTARRYS